MARLPDAATEWEADVLQLETTDPVVAGPPNIATKAGIANIPALQLARRTQYLWGLIKGLTMDGVKDSLTRLAMTVAERNKLKDIASNATANSSDANLRDRRTHTNTQKTETIDGLDTALAGKAAKKHDHVTTDITTVGGTNLQTFLAGQPTQDQVNEINEKLADRLYGARDIAPLGFQRFGSSGIQFRWGYANTSSSGSRQILFENPFQNDCFIVICQDRYTGASTSNADKISVDSDSFTKNGFRVIGVAGNVDTFKETSFYFLAIGY